MNQGNFEFKSNTNGFPIFGKSLIRGVMYIPVNKLRAFITEQDYANLAKGITFKKFTLEATSTPNLLDFVGREVLIDKSLETSLHTRKYDRIDNPRKLSNILELLKETKGKLVNDLIVNHVEVEVWEYFILWDNELVYIIDPTMKTISEGLLIPELEGKELAEGEKDEPNVLDINLKNTKLTGDDIKARLELPNKK